MWRRRGRWGRGTVGEGAAESLRGAGDPWLYVADVAHQAGEKGWSEEPQPGEVSVWMSVGVRTVP